MERFVYDVNEVAQMLGVNIKTAYEAIKNGDIPSIRIRGRIKVPCKAFDALLATGKAA